MEKTVSDALPSQESRESVCAGAPRPIKRPACLPDSLAHADGTVVKACSSSGAEALLPDSPLLVPLVLLLAAYVVCVFPDGGVAVLLWLGALATFAPTAEPLHRLVVEMFEKVARRASASEKLCALARDQARAALADPVTKQCFIEATSESLLQSLQDPRSQAMLVACCSEAVTIATIEASQDEKFQATLNSVMRSGVKEALSDETVVNAFFTVVKEGLRDPKLHQAVMKGAVSAANPLKDLAVPKWNLEAVPANPLKDIELPPLRDITVTNLVSALHQTGGQARIDAEAEFLANASGLSRAPPPTVQCSRSPSSKSGSPPLGPDEAGPPCLSNAFGEVSVQLPDPGRPSTRRPPSGSDHSLPDPLEAFIANGRVS